MGLLAEAETSLCLSEMSGCLKALQEVQRMLLKALELQRKLIADLDVRVARLEAKRGSDGTD